MKKIQVIAILLMATLAMGACKSSDSSSSSGGGGGNTSVADKPVYEEGTHESTVENLDGYYIKEGKSDYAIVIPQNSGSMIAFAASDMQSLILEATQVELPIITDDSLNATSASKIISIGQTQAYKNASVTLIDEMKNTDGYKIVSIDDDVFMCGYNDYGSMYAVYDFLYYTLGFKQYYEDCYTLTKTNTVQMKNFDVVEIPDFTYRADFNSYQVNNTTVSRRMRLHEIPWTTVGGLPWHNSLKWVPYDEAHPYWYADSKAELCFSAHGDEQELELMLNRALETFKGIYATQPNMSAVTFTQQDIYDWCVCPKCSEYKKTYGTNSAVMIPFMNRLSEMMEEYVTSLHADDPNFEYNIDLLFFAYNSTTNAPVVKNAETGEFEAIDDSMYLGEHVAVFYAPIYLDYTSSIYDKINQTYHDNVLAWKALSNRLYMWTYAINYTYKLLPYDTFNHMQELFQFLASNNAYYLFNQGEVERKTVGRTGWDNLKAYLDSELKWNVNADVATLTENFFNAMYGKASDTMKDMHYSVRTYLLKLHDDGLYTGNFSVYHKALKSEYWPYQLLQQWMKYIDKALTEIEYLKTADAKQYELIYTHIVCERIMISYLMLELYESKLTPEYKAFLTESLADDVARNQMQIYF